MFTTIFNRSSPVFRRQAPAAALQRGLRTTPVVRSAAGYGDPPEDKDATGGTPTPANSPNPTPQGSSGQKGTTDPETKGSSSSTGSSGSASSKDNASNADSSGEAVSQAPKGKVSTQGTEHGAQGNGPDPQAESHMGSQEGGGKPPSQQETKKVGEKPKSS